MSAPPDDDGNWTPVISRKSTRGRQVQADRAAQEQARPNSSDGRGRNPQRGRYGGGRGRSSSTGSRDSYTSGGSPAPLGRPPSGRSTPAGSSSGNVPYNDDFPPLGSLSLSSREPTRPYTPPTGAPGPSGSGQSTPSSTSSGNVGPINNKDRLLPSGPGQPGRSPSPMGAPGPSSGQSTPSSSSSGNVDINYNNRVLASGLGQSGPYPPPMGAPGPSSRPSTSGGLAFGSFGQAAQAEVRRKDANQFIPGAHRQVEEVQEEVLDDDIPERDPESLRALARRMCRNVYRRECTTEEERWFQGVVNSYVNSHRRSNAIYPARPRATNFNNEYFDSGPHPVLANHVKVRFNYDRDRQMPKYQLYTVTWFQSQVYDGDDATHVRSWKSVTGGAAKQVRWWDRVLHEHGKDPNGMNNVSPKYDGVSLLVSNRPLNFDEEELSTNGVSLEFGLAPDRMKVRIQSKETLELHECDAFVNNKGTTDFPQVRTYARMHHGRYIYDLLRYISSISFVSGFFPDPFVFIPWIWLGKTFPEISLWHSLLIGLLLSWKLSSDGSLMLCVLVGIQTVVQTLNKVMKHYCASPEYTKSGRFFFKKTENGKNLDGELLDFKKGYFQSVRALQGSLTLNVDIMHTAFYKPNMSLDTAWDKMKKSYLEETCKAAFRDWDLRNEWTETQVDIANASWKDLRIQSTHRNDNILRFYTISQFSDKSAAKQDITLYEDNRAKLGHSVCKLSTFMDTVYELSARECDQKPNMPAIQVSPDLDPGNSYKYYLPWGCCKTTNDTRYAGMVKGGCLKHLGMHVGDRYDGVKNWIKDRSNAEKDLELYLDVTVENELLQADAVVMARPLMEATALEGNDIRAQLTRTDKGDFLFGPTTKMMQPAIGVKSWALLKFNTINDRALRTFREKLSVEARKRGLTWLSSEPWYDWSYRTSYYDTEARKRNNLKQLLSENVPNAVGEQGLGLIVCVMSKRMTPEYATLKFECDKTYGVQTQVVVLSDSLLASQWRMNTFVANLMLKINVKCGGVNFRVSQMSMGTINIMRPESNTMLLGADVTHPRAGDRKSPSLAAVVATTDSSALQYACRIMPQRNREETIQGMQTMVEELLKVFRNKSGSLPDHILFFRDGLSEAQYTKCLCSEGIAILQAACSFPNYNPKLFIVLAIKRHHTRFFLKNDGVQVENIKQGTVVYGGVTHPREYDFFLLSQAQETMKTSRATRYYVLLDQIKMAQVDLYRLVYYLCHTFQRCPKVVSLVAPVNYAHVAATRARLYLDHYIAECQRGREDLIHSKDFNAHDNLKDQLWFL